MCVGGEEEEVRGGRWVVLLEWRTKMAADISSFYLFSLNFFNIFFFFLCVCVRVSVFAVADFSIPAGKSGRSHFGAEFITGFG